jgi:hypothetical protein
MRIISLLFFFLLIMKVGSKPEFEASYHNWKRVSMKLASTRELADSLASLAAACNDPGRIIKGEVGQYQGVG